MTNKTKLNDEFILTVKKEMQLSGQSITKYLTYSIFSIIAAIVLFCVYRTTNEILGIILPIIIVIAVVIYSIYFFGKALSWGKKGSKEVYIVEYLFDKDFIKITMEENTHAVSYSRITKSYYVGNYLILVTNADPIIIDKNAFIDCSFEDFKTFLSQKHININ